MVIKTWLPLVGNILFVDSYMQHELPESLDEENRAYLNDLFEWLLQPCFDFIRHNCKQILLTSELHLARSLMTTLTCLMDEIKMAGQDGNEMNQQTVGLFSVCGSSPHERVSCYVVNILANVQKKSAEVPVYWGKCPALGNEWVWFFILVASFFRQIVHLRTL